MKHLLLILALCGFSVYSFGQVAKGAGVFYFSAEPTLSLNLCYDSEIGIDSSTGLWWEYSRDLGVWIPAGFRIQKFAGCTAPTATPLDKQSEVLLNDCDSLYRWRAGAWHLLNGGVTAGSGTDLSYSGTSSPITINSSTGADITVTAGTGVSLSATSGNMTITNTAPDQTVTITNGGGILVSGSYPNFTLTAVDSSITNESFTISDGTNSENMGGQTLIVAGAGINVAVYNPTTNTLTITGTEVDGSTSNELQTFGHSGTTSYTNTLSNGGGSFTLQSSGIVTISNSSGTVTIGATEVDGSVTNELQTLANTSNATTHTVTLSNSGGSVQLVEGSGITLTTTGTTLDGIVTIAASDPSATNEAWTIDGDDADTEVISNQTVKFQGAGITVTDYNPATDVLLITSTEVDGSVSNELQTYAHSGTTSYTNTLSNGGGSFTLQSSGIVTISNSSGTVTIGATEVDGSTTNEVLTISDGTNSEALGGQTLTVAGAGINVAVYNPATNTLTITGTEVDGSVTNEGTLGVGAGGATSSVITSNTSGATGVTINAAGILAISESTSSNGGSITLTATEVDGSTSNELQTYAHSGTTSYTNTLSNGGGSFTLQGGGIVTLSHSSGTTTISATEVDGSVTNEAWTIDGDDTDTEVISNQTVKFQGAGITITDYNPATDVLLITSTEVDGSITNEGSLTVTAGGTNDSQIASNTSGSTNIVINGGSGISVTESGSTITISATGGSANYQLWLDDGVSVTPQPNANFVSTSDIAFTLTNDGPNTETEVSADIPVNAVNYSEIQQVSANRLLGNPTGSTADVSEISLGTGLSFVGSVLTPADASATNELQTYAHSGTTSYTNTLSNGGGSFTLQSSGIVTISNSSGTVTIGATEVDGSVTNEAWTIDGDDADTEVISNQTVKFQGAGITTTDYNPATDVLLITSTEVDGSTSNELQTLANTSDATTHTVTLSNSGGSVQLVEGSGITLTTTGTTLNGIVTVAASDPSATNEAWTIDGDDTDTEVISNQTVKFQGAGITTTDYNPATDVLLITSTEVDGSVSNELQTYAHSGTTSYTNTLSNSGGSFTLQSSGIVTISNSSGTVTIGAAEVDGSVTNELQTLSNTSNATTHTATLSNSGGSIQLVEGTGITLTTTGTTLDGIVTIAATAAGTDLTFSGASSPVTLNSSTGTDVTITAGGIISFSATSGNITITATEVDGSTTNELQTYSHSGTTSYTNTLSNGGGSFTLQSSGIVTISNSSGTVTIGATEVDGSVTNEVLTISDGTNSEALGGQTLTVAGAGINVAVYNPATNTLTITGTEVDGSVTNELQTLANTSDATSHTVTLSNSGGSVQMVEGSGITLTTTGTSGAGIVTIAASDPSATNEAWTIDGDDADTEVISNQTVKFQGAGITTTDYNPATDVLLITSTEVDGSISNELQTYAHSGTTSYTNTLSNGGGSFTLQSSGIVTISNSSGTVTIGATEVDGSVTNELQTIANTSDATSHTVTLSNSGGSVQMVEGTGITLTTTGTSGAGIVTIANTGDLSTTNEAWTIDGDDADTEVISNQTVKFQGAGITTTDYNPATDVLLITSTEVDGSTTNEVLTISDGTNSEAMGGQTLTVAGAGINVTVYNPATNTLTITGTEVDGSVTNELQTFGHSGTTSYTNTLSNGGGSFTLQSSGIVTISNSSGTVTIGATEVDGSVSNELQTIANTSDATSHTVTLSNSGGSIQIVEGAGISLTTTGTSGAGILTIASTNADQNGIYGEPTGSPTAGSGDGTLPPGGSTVTIPGQWQPLQFNTSATTGEIETAIRVVSSQPNSDTQWTKYLVGKTPSDSLEIMAYDGGTYIQETGGQILITTDHQLYLIADSVNVSTVPLKTTIPSIFGSTATGWLQKIQGTSTGQYLTWNQTNGNWEISTAPGGGNVSGTGANGRSTFWTGTSTVSGDDAYWWDNTNKRLGLGTAAGTPSAQLEGRTNSLGTTQTTTAGFALTNTTAAAVGAQQISPALRWTGQGWKTNATAASQAVEFRAYVTPVQGTANPSGYLGFGSAINGSWTNDRFNINSGGEVGIGTTTFTGSGAFAKLNVYGGNATDFIPYVFNAFATSQSGGVVYGQISNLLTTATTVFSFNEVADINSIKAGIRRYGSTHATRPNELEFFNQQSAPITLATNGSTRYTMSNTGVAFQPGAFGAGQSSAAAVTSTLTTTSLGTAYLETVGSPTFDATVHTVVYTASTNISWTLPTAAACACAGRQYILHHAGTAGTITLSQTITKGNAGNFNTLTAGQWAYVIYGSSTIRGYKVISL